MGYRPQIRSSQSGRGHQKAQRKKAKGKAPKHQVGGKYTPAETQAIPAREVAEKTLRRLGGLGNQKFALSPFSDYFDDWLVNLKEVMSEFESNQAINVDDDFVKEQTRTLTNIAHELDARRSEEAALREATKSLADNNHLLVEMDAEYAKATRELASRRNSEIQLLTRKVHDLEEELDRVGHMKTSIFSPFSKKAKAQREAEATRKLDSAKSELESVVHSFTVEQEKLHDEYEKRKQEIIEKVRSLEKEVEKLETDGSLEVRRAACEALANAVNAFLQRQNSLP
jgi:vacuolar-type H+-ATPase subunit I/STV1